jgi:hypothetical protein
VSGGVKLQTAMDKAGIVLNRMYVGDYLSTNLGHEVINLFKADNGNHYVYLNSTGNFAAVHKGKIGYMLFVKYHKEDEMEVIGMATELEEVVGSDQSLGQNYKTLNKTIHAAQKEFIKHEPDGGVKYGGVSILDIFNNAEQQSIFITYKAGKVYKPVKELRIFLRYGENAQNEVVGNNHYFALKSYNLPKTSLKSYIYPENNEDKCVDYNNVLKNLINNKELWTTEGIEKVNVKNTKIQQSVSIFDICQIHNDENRFSYALAHFMMQKKYRELWQKFFAQRGIELGKDYTVTREEDANIKDSEWDNDNKPGGGRIDLLIKDDNNIIVIENKIKSDINTIATDGDDSTQLNRYVNYVDWLVQTEYEQKPNSYFIILTPSYNIPTIKDEDMKKLYKIITYADLYSFLKNNLFNFYNDANFVAFFEAMERHTHKNVNDYLYYEMQEKFYRRIKK